MEIRNCTPHVLNIIKQDGEVLDLLPCGIVPRCSQSEECVLVINDIALTRQTFGEVVDLPEPEKDVMLVVSRLVASACVLTVLICLYLGHWCEIAKER